MKKIYSYSLSAAFVAALLSVSSVANAQDNSEVKVEDALCGYLRGFDLGA